MVIFCIGVYVLIGIGCGAKAHEYAVSKEEFKHEANMRAFTAALMWPCAIGWILCRIADEEEGK